MHPHDVKLIKIQHLWKQIEPKNENWKPTIIKPGIKRLAQADYSANLEPDHRNFAPMT